MGEEHKVPALARESLTYYLHYGRLMDKPAVLPEVLSGRAGAFVSFKKGGHLRGCIGTFAPTRPTIAEEIIQNAVSAGTEDPRFPPIALSEVPDLEISVDILAAPEQIDSIEALDPKQFGVIVRTGRRSGLLLPDLAGVDTAVGQVAIAREKAGIGPDEAVELYRFSVTRYK